MGCGLRRTRNGARLCEGPHGTLGEVRTKARPKIVPTGLGPKCLRGPKTGGKYPWWGSTGGGLRKTRNRARLCEGPRCTHGELVAQLRPKIMPKVVVPKSPKGPRDGWAISLVGGASEVRPPDSEWGEALQGASVCPRGVAGTAAPKNSSPRSGYQKGPSRKSP